MFRVASIQGIINEHFDEECFKIEEAFFFTIKIQSYYVVYDITSEVIGIIPTGYNLFFKADEYTNFEDVDMENILRLFDMNVEFLIVGTKDASNKVNLISSKNISDFKLVEDKPISIPFTNNAFDSEGIIVFRNMSSLAESIVTKKTF